MIKMFAMLGMAMALAGGTDTLPPTSTEPPTQEVVKDSTEGNSTAIAPTPEPDKEDGTSTTPTPEVKDDMQFNWKEWAKEFLSPQVLTTIITLVSFLATIIKLATSLKSAIHDKKVTIDEINSLVLGEIKKDLPVEIASQIDNYMPKILEMEKKNNDIMIIFSKILAESQKGDAQSRIAILSLLEQLTLVDHDTIENAKQVVNRQEETKAKKEEEQKQAVADVIKQTEGFDGTSI